jgi:hypothetical protein
MRCPNPPFCPGQSKEICIVRLNVIGGREVSKDWTGSHGVDSDTLADAELASN